jgi:hypothetical protein
MQEHHVVRQDGSRLDPLPIGDPNRAAFAREGQSGAIAKLAILRHQQDFHCRCQDTARAMPSRNHGAGLTNARVPADQNEDEC